MNLGDIVDTIGQRCGLVQDRDREACKTFVILRHDQIFRSRLWKDSLIEYLLPIDPNADYSPADSYLPTKGVLILPKIFQHVVAVRTSERKLDIQRPMIFYRVDQDSFAQTGQPLDYMLLSATAWELDVEFPLQLIIPSAADIGVTAKADIVDSDGVGVTRTTFILKSTGVLVTMTDRIDGLIKPVTDGIVYVDAPPAEVVVAGAGVAALNATYTLAQGLCNDRPFYFNGNAATSDGAITFSGTGNIIYWTGAQWYIAIITAGIFANYYTSFDDAITPGQVTTWLSGLIINNPIPTVTGALAAVITLATTDTDAPKRQRIRLVDIPDSSTTVRVLGKRTTPIFADDSDSPGINGMEGVLVALGYYDMLHRDERGGTPEADMALKEAGALVQQLEAEEVAQAAHNSRILPESGFGSDEFAIGPQF